MHTYNSAAAVGAREKAGPVNAGCGRPTISSELAWCRATQAWAAEQLGGGASDQRIVSLGLADALAEECLILLEGR